MKKQIKHLPNIELLHEFPFYDKFSVVEISKAFKRYAKSYKLELIELKDPSVQLEASKSSIEVFLNETNSFKYQVTVIVLLCKHKVNGHIEYALVFFNSTTKTVNNSDEYDFVKSFQKILYRRHNWINERFGWIIESISGNM